MGVVVMPALVGLYVLVEAHGLADGFVFVWDEFVVLNEFAHEAALCHAPEAF